MAENTPSKPQESSGAKKKVEPHSHVLLLADGSQVRWSADDANPHAPVPSDVEGVPVVNVVHAYERSDNE
jgi:hypothetical protein